MYNSFDNESKCTRDVAPAAPASMPQYSTPDNPPSDNATTIGDGDCYWCNEKPGIEISDGRLRCRLAGTGAVAVAIVG